MAATSSAAIKAHLEAQGLGISVHRDTAPKDATYPYVTVQEAISVTPDLHGDNGADPSVAEQVQVDVWQRWKDAASGSVTESYTLPDAVAEALSGAVLTSVGSRHVYGVTFDFSVRFLERETNTVHHAVTCTVRRDL